MAREVTYCVAAPQSVSITDQNISDSEKSQLRKIYLFGLRKLSINFSFAFIPI